MKFGLTSNFCLAVVLLAGLLPGMAAAQDRIQVPDFSLKTIDGETWTLKQNAGSVLVLNFWATWCGPCRTEIPYLVKLQDEFEKRGLKVAGINLDEDAPAEVRNFAVDYKIDYPVLMPEPGSPFAQAEKVPMTLMIDARGRLAKKYFGAVPEEVLRKDIEELLAEMVSEKAGY
jgi:cytochrome c biogenesis protein CcmG, thiol:disulfide interchange protein DsbE